MDEFEALKLKEKNTLFDKFIDIVLILKSYQYLVIIHWKLLQGLLIV